MCDKYVSFVLEEFFIPSSNCYGEDELIVPWRWQAVFLSVALTESAEKNALFFCKGFFAAPSLQRWNFYLAWLSIALAIERFGITLIYPATCSGKFAFLFPLHGFSFQFLPLDCAAFVKKEHKKTTAVEKTTVVLNLIYSESCFGNR